MCPLLSPPKGDRKYSWMARPTFCLIFAVGGMVSVVVLYCILPPTFSNLGNRQDGPPIQPFEGGHNGSVKKPDFPVVETPNGRIHGAYSPRSGRIRVFHGVPYAKPPTGELRWRAPVEPESWGPNVFYATQKRPGCPQECSIPFYCLDSTSEDCLFLEIYAPAELSAPTPVMVYFHGGSFQDVMVTIPVFDATALVERSQLIVVLVEFRLGALGYLVTGRGDGQAEGNYGIQDQRQALKWINENIEYFGGDPNQVTLVGQSSGAQSALISLVSDASRYFRSLIIESAPLTLPYRTLKDATGQGRRFAQILNCTNNKVVNMTCLREKSPQQIVEAQKKTVETEMTITARIEPWSPVVDGTYLHSQPLDSLREYAENGTDIKPILCGYTTEEGLGFVEAIFTDPIPYFMYQIVLGTVLDDVPQGMDKLYPVADESDTREVISQIMTDLVFRCPLRYFLKMLKAAGHEDAAWLYAWDRPLDADIPEELSRCNNRSCHSVEIPFVFHTLSLVLNSSSEKDNELSYSLIDLYTNFIKYGKPSRDKNLTGTVKNSSSEVPVKGASPLIDWPPATSKLREGITRLIFTRDARLQAATDETDAQCDAWDKVGYSILGGSGD